ncbi:hypothetical protein PRIPAC_85087 [Pristionchus pacificus]|uniref:Uncharacterized protein n=1 Tax=Pristionchus pacificus TaxID=54126 RepID=A0A2A6BT12_PRIPA|nr:hypothetical protein PRIPAC_85087 [Pristionchus pacificus]|eukprot:PDM68943.1 hypothetical protein PRIPAC_47245 [Pristionchus pacificus]
MKRRLLAFQTISFISQTHIISFNTKNHTRCSQSWMPNYKANTVCGNCPCSSSFPPLSTQNAHLRYRERMKNRVSLRRKKDYAVKE